MVPSPPTLATTSETEINIDPAVLAKVKAAADVYRLINTSTNKDSQFDFDLWKLFVVLIDTFDRSLPGTCTARQRDELVQQHLGISRSTARRHIQVLRELHLIDKPERAASFKELYRKLQETR